MRRLKIFVTVFFLVILFSFLSKAEAFQTNAHMIQYGTNTSPLEFLLVVPDDFSGYDYLSHYPWTAFLFVQDYDERKIDQLTVTQIKSGSLGRYSSYHVLSFSKIKGFEEMAELLKTADEFEIESKKDHIKAKLKECYRKYYNEFKTKYLNNYFTFVSYHHHDGTKAEMLPEYNPPSIKDEKDFRGHRMTKESHRYVDKISKRQYDFDRKLLTLYALGGVPEEHHLNSSWKRAYVDRINNAKYNKRFPEQMQINVSIEDARKLFSGRNLSCVTVLTVKPRQGIILFTQRPRIQQFNIHKITKIFYDESHSYDNPNLIIEIPSNPMKPLY